MRTIEQMAEEAFGAVFARNCIDPEQLRHFAALVAEQCAHLCKSASRQFAMYGDTRTPAADSCAEDITAAFPKP